jgi:hypothetical protein
MQRTVMEHYQMHTVPTCLLPYWRWSNSERNLVAPWGWHCFEETCRIRRANKETYNLVHSLVNLYIIYIILLAYIVINLSRIIREFEILGRRLNNRDIPALSPCYIIVLILGLWTMFLFKNYLFTNSDLSIVSVVSVLLTPLNMLLVVQITFQKGNCHFATKLKFS